MVQGPASATCFWLMSDLLEAQSLLINIVIIISSSYKYDICIHFYLYIFT